MAYQLSFKYLSLRMHFISRLLSSFREEVIIVTVFQQTWVKCHWSDLISRRPVVWPRVEYRYWSSFSTWLSRVRAVISLGMRISHVDKEYLHSVHTGTWFDLTSHVESMQKGGWERSPSVRVQQPHTAASSSAGSVIFTQQLDSGSVHFLEIIRLMGKQCSNLNTGTFQEVVVSGGINSNTEFSFCLQASQSRRLHN